MKKLAISLSLVMLSGANYAATKESQTKLKTKKGASTDKADEVITNRRLRASQGSLSDLSINTAFSYSGGSLMKPLAAERPNIGAVGSTVAVASMSGNISGSYRLSKLQRLGFGTGVNMMAPFNSTIETSDPRAEQSFNDNQGKLNVNNPFVSYSYITQMAGVQTIFGGSITEVTVQANRDIGMIRTYDATLNTMYNFGGSRFSIGAFMFATKYQNDPGADSPGSLLNTMYGFLPQAEYVLNDTYNLRTIVHSHKYASSEATPNDFERLLVTQSVGLGISVNRDVFLYPNIQFAHDNLQLSQTNIGLSANINFF